MVPSLQELCEVGAALSLISNPAIKEVIYATSEHLDFSINTMNIKERNCWHDKFLNEISKLTKGGPRLLRNNPIHLVPLISVDILKWARFHNETFHLSFEYIKDFINNSLFTKEGTIDREKAARALFEDGSLKPSTRFKIICFYSLTDIIMISWSIVPNAKVPDLRSDDNAAVRLWTDFILGYYKGTNLSLDLLYSAIDCGSEMSFCSHWKNLDEEAKIDVVNYFVEIFQKKLKLWKKPRKDVDYIYTCEPYINIFKFLVKNLDIEKVKALLTEHQLSYWLLINMLRWPYQSSFLDTELVKEILTRHEYFCLLIEIILKIDDPFHGKSYDYRILFQKFWIEIPQVFKSNFFEFSIHNNLTNRDFQFGTDYLPPINPYGYNVLVELFKLDFTDDDDEIVRWILGGFEVFKLQHFAEVYGKDVCDEAIAAGNLMCADLFLECCKVDSIVFKKSLIETLFEKTLVNLIKEFKLDKIDRILKWVLTPNEFRIFKEKFSAFMSENSNLKTEGNSITIPNEDKELVINVDDFVKNFRNYLINEEFEKATIF